MKTKDVILNVQAALLIPEDKRFPNVGPLTRAAFNKLVNSPIEGDYYPPIGIDLDVSRRDINLRGLELVKHFESCLEPIGNGKFQAYKDIAGVWTIGYGHTGLVHEDGTVYKGRIISQEKADQLLQYDMQQTEEQVLSLVRNTLTDDQFAALVSFHFNTGGLKGSTLLTYLNEGNYKLAADQFLRWNKVNGKIVKGLVRRRMSEKLLFEGETPYIVESV